MTCGIYKLEFKNTHKIYIGQSINIEARYIKHLSDLYRGKGAHKLQEAYNIYGKPYLVIILECSKKELDSAEKDAIEIFDSIDNGFNTLPDAGTPILVGENNPNAACTNNQYIHILKLLVQEEPRLTKKEISDSLGVPLYVVRHIAALESHTWLKEAEPELYYKLELQKSSKFYRGRQYPKLVSPEGSIHEVLNISEFARTYNLLQPKITELFKGTRKVHKGWKVIS